MDPYSLATNTSNEPRKVRFAPKAPSKREPNLVLPKPEKIENDVEDSTADQLIRRLNETTLPGKPKAERKVAPTKVAFGFGRPSSLRSYGTPKNTKRNHGLSSDGASDQGIEKEYKEPWNYYDYYPATLPLRRPYSGNPELLDQREFSEDPQSSNYDENEENSAAELGLLDENEESNMLFLQLPNTLPMFKLQSTNAEGHENENNANSKKGSQKAQKPSKIEELTEGLVGKMLVYKSGAIKLKLGDTLYNVSTAEDCLSAQDVFTMNTEDGHCCNLGELNKCASVTLDADPILENAP